MTLPLFSIVSETSQNAPCNVEGSTDEAKAMPPASEPENPKLEAVPEAILEAGSTKEAREMSSSSLVQSKSEASETELGDSEAVDCSQYPGGCLACPDYRGTVRWWCRKLHWWKPWATPTGELPTVEIRRGHVRHVYRDGTTRLVGIAAAPTIPASVIPPVPVEGTAAPKIKAERWYDATKRASA